MCVQVRDRRGRPDAGRFAGARQALAPEEAEGSVSKPESSREFCAETVQGEAQRALKLWCPPAGALRGAMP